MREKAREKGGKGSEHHVMHVAVNLLRVIDITVPSAQIMIYVSRASLQMYTQVHTQ